MAGLRRVVEVPRAPARPAGGHKGLFGTVVVVGGSRGMIGAPAMSAHAAFRAGAGLVKLAVDAEVLPHAIGIEPSATGVVLSGGVAERLAAVESADPGGEAVLAIGPGLGREAVSGGLVMGLLGTGRRVVLDADGLNLLAERGVARDVRPAGAATVLTPHPGEFRRLAGPLGIGSSPTEASERPAAAAALARAHGAVVVLKGERSVVSDGERVWVSAEPGPAVLGAAGTGDVLTGMAAALMAQGLEGFDAAVLAVHAGLRAADAWERAQGARRGMLARELADGLPAALEALAGEG